MTTKADMLSRVRQALGSGSGASEKPRERVPLHDSPAAYVPDSGRVRRFQTELQRVGGRATTVHSPEETHDYIRRLLAGKSSVVAISDEAAEREPHLREFVAGLGAKLIPSLREYAVSLDNPTTPDLGETYKRSLFEADLGITCADYAIADTGTLVISSKRAASRDTAPDDSTRARSSGEQHRLISLVPATHLCLLDASNIVRDLKEFFMLADGRLYSGGAPPLVMTFITGPSRTADIELTLTMGVHGPRELHVLIFVPPD